MKGINGQAFAPEKVEVSFIYDFMDQAKTACPRFKRYGCPKNAEGGNQRIFRIMGVKVRRVAAVERTRGSSPRVSPRVLDPPRVSRSASSSSSLPPPERCTIMFVQLPWSGAWLRLHSVLRG